MEEFNRTIQKNMQHIVYFGASWCTNCQLIKEKLATIEHLSYDVIEDEEIADYCGIIQIPTIEIWKSGKCVEKLQGSTKCMNYLENN